MKVSSVLVNVRSFRDRTQEPVRARLVKGFAAALGEISCYEWRFVPKGSVLVEYGDRPALFADTDYAEICAFGGST